MSIIESEEDSLNVSRTERCLFLELSRSEEGQEELDFSRGTSVFSLTASLLSSGLEH